MTDSRQSHPERHSGGRYHQGAEERGVYQYTDGQSDAKILDLRPSAGTNNLRSAALSDLGNSGRS
jgi:hypothetical protein